MRNKVIGLGLLPIAFAGALWSGESFERGGVAVPVASVSQPVDLEALFV